MVISTMSALTLGALTILPYQSYGIDLIINSAGILLSFGKLDNQYQCICYCCIKIQHIICCLNRKNTKSIHEANIDNNNNDKLSENESKKDVKSLETTL